MYSQAIAGDAQDHTLFSNRSAAYLAQGLYEQAGGWRGGARPLLWQAAGTPSRPRCRLLGAAPA